MEMTVELGEKLTIANVHEQHINWRQYFASDDDLMVDAGNLKSVDSAGLQMLLVLKQSVERRSRSFSWSTVSDEMRAIAALVGLVADLELDNE